MNKNKQFVISINRELGSGGRTVGEKLAQKLGVSFYDKALIKALEEKYNLTTEEIEALKGRSHSWWADFKRVIGLGYSVSNNPDWILHLPQPSQPPQHPHPGFYGAACTTSCPQAEHHAPTG